MKILDHFFIYLEEPSRKLVKFSGCALVFALVILFPLNLISQSQVMKQDFIPVDG